ncbi:MAG: class I SAM-dependent rRNA methyltransferase [bacterium]
MEVIRLKRTSRVLEGHLWVFSNELTASPKQYEPGTVVELRDKKDVFLGIGYVNPQSLIAVRILTHEREEITPAFFKKRILDALEYRKRFIRNTNAYRVVFSESDFISGLIVDRYDTCLAVQFLTAGMEKQAEVILGVLDETFSPSVIVLRNDSSSRLLEGLPRERKIVRGTLDTLPVIQEDGIRFEVNPLAGQKTGFFLDQRANRTAFSHLIEGGEGLDLFCYAGAWSMHLAARGSHVIGLDESDVAVEQARRNAELNGLEKQCEFLKDNVFTFLGKQINENRKYDFVVLDPPAFVKNKAKIREGLRGYREINAHALKLLKKHGLLATSSCSYHIDRETFLEMLRSSARDAGRKVRILEMRSQARDHPVLLPMPETEYLKCLFLEVI